MAKSKEINMQWIMIKDVFDVLWDLEERFGDDKTSDILAQVPEMATDALMALARNTDMEINVEKQGD